MRGARDWVTHSTAFYSMSRAASAGRGRKSTIFMITISVSFGIDYTADIDLQIQTVRLGLNYKFD